MRYCNLRISLCCGVGATAIQRKILLLLYTLWKKDETFNENYLEPAIDQQPDPLLTFRKEVSRSKDLPTQDEHLIDKSTEVLLH